MLKQDLHIHTIFSKDDGAVVEQQTLEMVKALNHAEVIGISDHYESLRDDFDEYKKAVKSFGFHLGTEVDGATSVDGAAELDVEYYFYHCWNTDDNYRGIEKLLATNKPVIISHPNATGTDLNRIPKECLVEINNRYIWQSDWNKDLSPFVDRFRWVFSSDAHKPSWLCQNVAIHAANQLGIQETILF